MFTDPDTHCLSAVIDWEFSGVEYVSTFAQYLFFIIDHPWDKDHPLRERNVRDQATFNEILLEEVRRFHASYLRAMASISFNK